MSEAAFKLDLINGFSALGWHITRHEDRDMPFIPDLSFAANGTDGWMEAKYMTRAPESINDIHHWTRGQQHWLENRGAAGSGHCYLVVGVGPEVFAWRWDALGIVRNITWQDASRWQFIASGSVGDFCRGMDFRVRRAGVPRRTTT